VRRQAGTGAGSGSAILQGIAIRDEGDVSNRVPRGVLLVLVAVLGFVTSLLGALSLLPRVKLVEVVTVFAGGVGAGAALVAAVVEFRKERLPAAGHRR
jgi:hypothetical protein